MAGFENVYGHHIIFSLICCLDSIRFHVPVLAPIIVLALVPVLVPIIVLVPFNAALLQFSFRHDPHRPFGSIQGLAHEDGTSQASSVAELLHCIANESCPRAETSE